MCVPGRSARPGIPFTYDGLGAPVEPLPAVAVERYGALSTGQRIGPPAHFPSYWLLALHFCDHPAERAEQGCVTLEGWVHEQEAPPARRPARRRPAKTLLRYISDMHAWSNVSPEARDQTARLGRLGVSGTERDGLADRLALLQRLQRMAGNRATGIMVQRLNNLTASQANTLAVNDVDTYFGGSASSLLSGWGNGHIAGHWGHQFSAATRQSVDALGNAGGCTNCKGSPSGWASGHWTPDHEPPNSLSYAGYAGPVRFYPHCKTCSQDQARVVARYKDAMKHFRQGTDNDWATGVQGNWFWN